MRDTIKFCAALVTVNKLKVCDGAASVTQGFIHVEAFIPAFRCESVGLALFKHLESSLGNPQRHPGGYNCKQKGDEAY
ncbi:MAG: hypothetical protein PHH11_03465 [Methylomonas sp.]|nr:hypothetical protein [Methylomonas sp.]